MKDKIYTGTVDFKNQNKLTVVQGRGENKIIYEIDSKGNKKLIRMSKRPLIR